MTDMQRLYQEQRDAGKGHYAALRALSRQTGLDPDTIHNTLERARQADSTRARRARRRGA